MTVERQKPRVLFVNAGILGLASFHSFLRDALPTQARIEWEQILLTEHLTLADRLLRRLITQRLWKDGLFGLVNLDFARLRYEINAGLHARRLIARAGVDRFDALHFHRTAAAYGSLDLMRRIPAIISIDCTQDAVIQASRTRLERRTYEANARVDGAIFRRAAAIVATSRWAADCLRARYPDCATPVHVLPTAVLLDRFDPGWAAERAARAAAGRRPRLLFMGGDFPRKGGFDLLAAWQAGRLSDEAELDIVSDWPVPPPLPAGVRVLRGIRHGTPEWAVAWREADLFVLPTRNEAFGLVFLEAGAAGLASVGTAHHAIPEIITDGETGLLTPVGDRDALIHAMRTLIRDGSLRARMGERARRAVESSTANPAIYLARLVDIVEEAAGRRRALR